MGEKSAFYIIHVMCILYDRISFTLLTLNLIRTDLVKQMSITTLRFLFCNFSIKIAKKIAALFISTRDEFITLANEA